MDDLSLQCLYQAWQQARAGKKPSHNQLVFESRWLDNLFALQESLQQGYALQLDIRNFFNRIHRPTLYRLLKQRLAKAQQQGKITPEKAVSLQWLCHRLLAQHPSKGVYYRDDASVRALVPAHKQLANAPQDCGLPIGNLTSQFFANVLLNELDQFIKHRLKCRHYVRYVDDFVLLHPDATQLQQWQQAIESFLASHLKLALKDKIILKPIRAGIDFLGYIVTPHHLQIRPRVLQHAKAKLAAFSHVHYRHGRLITSPTAQQALHAQLMSYLGHATHANVHRKLWRQWLTAYPWLSQRYVADSDQPVLKAIPPQNANFKQQWHWWRAVYADCPNQLIQRGGVYWHYRHDLGACPKARVPQRKLTAYLQQLRQQQQAYCLVRETGQGAHAMRRAVYETYLPTFPTEKPKCV